MHQQAWTKGKCWLSIAGVFDSPTRSLSWIEWLQLLGTSALSRPLNCRSVSSHCLQKTSRWPSIIRFGCWQLMFTKLNHSCVTNIGAKIYILGNIWSFSVSILWYAIVKHKLCLFLENLSYWRNVNLIRDKLQHSRCRGVGTAGALTPAMLKPRGRVA